MPTFCCCSNELSEGPKGLRVNMHPCRCEAPGGPKSGRSVGLPTYVFEKQYNERTRLGLPLETDTEKAIRRRWY
jgi:hypothetical protein